MVPDEVLSRRVRVVIVLSSLTIAVGLLTIGSLNCNITFTHAFTALRCIFEELTLLTTTKVISLRIHWDADST